MHNSQNCWWILLKWIYKLCNFSCLCCLWLVVCLQGQTRPSLGRAPWCSVIHLCCLALVLSSLTSVSLVLLLHGKTHLEYCLMRVASPNLVRNNGRGHRTRHEVFYGAVLQQGCKVWICFLAICGFHLHQLGSNIQIFSVYIANISLRLGFLSEGCLPVSLESQPPFPSTLHSLNASSPVNANSPTAFCIPKWYEE